MKLTRELVLASASPRRRDILAQLGLCFEVRVADVDEALVEGEDPRTYVTRLAQDKVRATAAMLSGKPVAVLGADTTVVLDGLVLAKPTSVEESERMLRALRGQEHVVHTSVALLLAPEAELRAATVSTRVRFRAFSDDTLRRYAASGEGLDKAGSYGIQELGAGLVRSIQGSYSSVVGLPAAETLELLEAAGVLEAWP